MAAASLLFWTFCGIWTDLMKAWARTAKAQRIQYTFGEMHSALWRPDHQPRFPPQRPDDPCLGCPGIVSLVRTRKLASLSVATLQFLLLQLALVVGPSFPTISSRLPAGWLHPLPCRPAESSQTEAGPMRWHGGWRVRRVPLVPSNRSGGQRPAGSITSKVFFRESVTEADGRTAARPGRQGPVNGAWPRTRPQTGEKKRNPGVAPDRSRTEDQIQPQCPCAYHSHLWLPRALWGASERLRCIAPKLAPVLEQRHRALERLPAPTEALGILADGPPGHTRPGGRAGGGGVG